MKHKFLVYSFVFAMLFSAQAQEEINNYKYILIPSTYQFLKGKDQYQVNSLAKFLFNKYGYSAFMEGQELPEDLNNNPCLALTADAEDVKGGFLITKLQFNLKDCRGNVIATSQVGKSKEKEYKAAYHEALREAFETFQSFEYDYQPSMVTSSNALVQSTPSSSVNETSKTDAEIERLKKEVEALKAKEKQNQKVITQIEEEVAQAEEEKEVKMEELTQESEVAPQIPAVQEEKIDWLYAQPIENGFQVVDTEPKKVMILLNSGRPNMYMVEGKDAIVYKEGDEWFYSETKETGPEVKKIHLKF